MKTSLLTIALFATLLFWSSCKEKSTEPLSTPEVIERIEMRFIGINPPYRDTMLITGEEVSFNFVYWERKDGRYYEKYRDTTISNTTAIFGEIASKIDLDYFFSLDSFYHIGLFGRCTADTQEYELIIETNKRKNKLYITCSEEKDGYAFDEFFETVILMYIPFKEAD